MSPLSSLVRSTRRATALSAFALVAFAAAPVRAQTPVVFGDTISDPGVYFLAGNQTGSGVGLRIESDDVLLLLGRFTLRGDDSSVGIVANGRTNVHIYGGRVTRFQVGIDILNGDECTVKDTRIDWCVFSGLRISDTEDSQFLRLRCDHNGRHGVDASGVDDSKFLSILAHDNGGNGILLAPRFTTVALGDAPESSFNKIKLCWSAYNGRDGIRVENGDDNEIERNQCVDNDFAGIRLASELPVALVTHDLGSQRNSLRSNWCVFNREGIAVQENSSENTLTNNTALANVEHDMVDDNPEPPCANTWFLNFFFTKDGAGEDCIF